MSVQSPLAQYQQVSNQEAVSGVSPHRLIQMLMEGALQRMAEAKGAIQRNDIAAKGEALGKAISIVGGLRDSLNMDAQGDISQQLDELYEYISNSLLEANLTNDEAKIDASGEALLIIKSAWDGIEE